MFGNRGAGLGQGCQAWAGSKAGGCLRQRLLTSQPGLLRAMARAAPAVFHLLEAHLESGHVWLCLQQTAELALGGLVSLGLAWSSFKYPQRIGCALPFLRSD